MKLSQLNSIKAAIAYADIFSQPLTISEIHYWLIGHGISVSQIVKYLKYATGVNINHPQNYFFHLSGRENIINTRIKRQLYSNQKRLIAYQVASLLKIIPTLKLVGVTGGLSMNNADINDDIDLFFITATNSLWISRLLVTIIVEIFFRRRHPNEVEVKDSICLNMFMTEDNLKLPLNEQDIYSAHEVMQMQPLWERGNIYHQFLQANSWVKGYLPNAYKLKIENSKLKNNNFKKNNSVIFNFTFLILNFFEPLARKIQLWYMQKHKTTEIVTDKVLRFHPEDMRGWIRKAYNNRLNKYNIPLDNQF
jgi:hypothetical protein